MAEKLDLFNKILIATGQINYLASQINMANAIVKLLDNEGWHIESTEAREGVLSETVTKLSAIMEDLADLMNNQDLTLEVDTRVTNVPFEILIHGKDDVAAEYN